jgi:hypothetical protein
VNHNAAGMSISITDAVTNPKFGSLQHLITAILRQNLNTRKELTPYQAWLRV